MSKLPEAIIFEHEERPLTLQMYVTGYVSSLVLTLTAYLLVTHHALTQTSLIAAIAILAFGQFIVQVLCFLHLGLERKPRWKLLVFGFMVSIVLILVIGSLWIMTHLNYHMPSDVKDYLHNNEGL